MSNSPASPPGIRCWAPSCWVPWGSPATAAGPTPESSAQSAQQEQHTRHNTVVVITRLEDLSVPSIKLITGTLLAVSSVSATATAERPCCYSACCHMQDTACDYKHSTSPLPHLEARPACDCDSPQHQDCHTHTRHGGLLRCIQRVTNRLVRRVWRSSHSSIAWGCGRYIGQQQGQETAVTTKLALCSFCLFCQRMRRSTAAEAAASSLCWYYGAEVLSYAGAA
jgi:hypothetical protein